jgi:putative phage-type endonuclease
MSNAEAILTTDDPEWHERRTAVVGASEVALLFGLESYGDKTVGDLWFEKKYGTNMSKGNESTYWGNKLEQIVLDEAEQRLGTKIVDRQRWLRVGDIGATLDGRLESSGAVIDAKTSGIVGPGNLSAWGDEMTDSIPENYLVQIQAQLLVTGAELGYIAALIGNRGFSIFQIEPHAELMAAIQAKAAEFIASLSGDVAPDEPPTLETLKRIKRQPNKVIPQSTELDDLYEQFESANTNAKAAVDLKETFQRQILAKLGDAEAAECQDGLITYFEQSRKESYVAASKFRVMRFKKGK